MTGRKERETEDINIRYKKKLVILEGQELGKVRTLHENQKIDAVPVCKDCTFKDTYSWVMVEL
jgi:hypothetical protein